MACCTQYCAAEAQFDRKVAERDLRRYRRRGADATTRLVLAELRRWPLQGRDLLDVGGGIGVIGAELAGTGIASATLVEASPAYLEVARREVSSHYESRPTQFLLGDFAVIAGTLPDADVVTLDRVVCCYPDAEALLQGAATRARQLLAFTYPRDRWYVWTLIVLENFWRRLTGNTFRAFVHSSQRMGAVLETAGLVRETPPRHVRMDTRPLSPTDRRLTPAKPIGPASVPGRLAFACKLSGKVSAPMDAKTHWEKVYTTKPPEEVSWYRAHLETSLALIERAAGARSASIIDVGGGESTLVDDLLFRGYENITVLDVSQTAIDLTKSRLGSARAEQVRWLVADITEIEMEPRAYDLWHDRAVFHFLTAREQRIAYVRQVTRSVRPGGHIIVSTFGSEGPTKCSGLEVMRYDAESLHGEFGTRFRLVESSKELHHTPFGTTQQFLYCYCRID